MRQDSQYETNDGNLYSESVDMSMSGWRIVKTNTAKLYHALFWGKESPKLIT